MRPTQKSDIKVVGKIELDKLEKRKPETKKQEKSEIKETKQSKTSAKTEEKSDKKQAESISLVPDKMQEPVIIDKIELDTKVPKDKKDLKQEPQRDKEKPKSEKPQSAVKKPDEIKKESKIDSKTEAVSTTTTEEESTFIPSRIEKLSGPKVLGRIELPDEKKRRTGEAATSTEESVDAKKKRRRRKRIKKERTEVDKPQENTTATKSKPAESDRTQHEVGGERKRRPQQATRKRAQAKPEISEDDVAKQIKDTLARLTTKTKSRAARYRREKRDAAHERQLHDTEEQQATKNVLKVTEFVSVNDLSAMMDVPINEVIATCMNMGLFVSINQRLDAETMALVVDEFGYKIEFVSAEVLEAIHDDEEDLEEDLVTRPPIVTVMGHVDHGKTSLLDRIRNSNVIAGEAGGITQHIGAYSVELPSGRVMTFLDTPGHEAFTAMRARGAQVTDVVIITIAADDSVMPQTLEAINHAQAAGVPIVFAINKIDKETANPEKIKQELANMNILVEDWGGKYQSQEISAKKGINVEELLEKVLVESDLLELKANPNRRASGTVIESQLDKGRGYVATVLVQNGTLKIGDIVLAGTTYGRVKAMFNERGQNVKSAGPATPIQILGINGAPLGW